MCMMAERKYILRYIIVNLESIVNILVIVNLQHLWIANDVMVVPGVVYIMVVRDVNV